MVVVVALSEAVAAADTYVPDTYVPVYQADDPFTFHHGLTFEYGLGPGYFEGLRQAASIQQGIAVGVWLHPRLAVTARAIAAELLTPNTNVGNKGNAAVLYVGLGAQVWLTSGLWVGGGLGKIAEVEYGGWETGPGFDARVGYSIGMTAAHDRPSPTHTLDFSVELTTGSVEYIGLGPPLRDTATAMTFLIGYQYL